MGGPENPKGFLPREPASAMLPSSPALKVGIVVALAPLVLIAVFYILLIGLGSTPYFQKHLLYAHKFHTAWFDDVKNPQLWGFPRNQARPFYLRNTRNEPLFAWHILPHNEFINLNAEAWDEPRASDLDAYIRSKAFDALRSDPDAKLVLYFHGNAGHIAQNTRPDLYRSITTIPNHHLVAIDYRGFALSHPLLPNEESLLDDAFTLINWAIHQAGIPPSRIILVGHSLGTAVASGAAERFIQHNASHQDASEIAFGGVVLVSSFSRLSRLLSQYRFGGVIPVFGPLVYAPRVTEWIVESFLVDDWHSEERVRSYVETLTRLELGGRVTFVHGLDDRDIPWTESRRLFDAAVGGMNEGWKEEVDVRGSDGSFILQRSGNEGGVVLRLEILPNGGHNTIIGLPSVAMAVQRCSVNPHK